MNTEKTKVSPLYLQLIDGMHRDKLKINDAKLARHGSIDIDDHGFIDFPEFNIADMYVVCSGILLVMLVCFRYKNDEDYDFLRIKKD